MNTVLRILGKRNEAHNTVLMNFPPELSGKAEVSLIQGDQTVKKQLKGDSCLLPVPGTGPYWVHVDMDTILWTEEVHNHISFTTKQINRTT